MPDGPRYVVAIDWDVADLASKIESKVALLSGKHVGKMPVDAAGKIGGLEGKFESLGRTASEALGRVGEAFTGAVERVGELATHFGMIGGAAVVGALTYGVGHLNTELEQTNLSLAAIFTAQGFAKDFTGGMKIAGDEVAKMKQDVKSLPGDLGQLAAIMTTIATPAAQAGADPDAIRKMAGRGMLVGQILGVSQDMVARELAMLLSGRSGAHNVLGTRLGFTGAASKKLNTESESKRFADINAAFDKYGPAADAFAESFTAKFTTLKDNVKYAFLAPLSSPLFNSVKHTIDDLNGWFDRNKSQVETFTSVFGARIAAAWSRGTEIFAEWWPAITKFAGDAYAEIGGIWTQLEPTISRIGEVIRTSLGDGTALKHLESILKLYGERKIWQAASSVVSPFASMGKGMFGALGGGGVAGEAGAAEGAIAGLGSAAMIAGGALAAIATTVAAGEITALAHGHRDAADAAGRLTTAVGQVTSDLTDGETWISRFIQKVGVEGTDELGKFFQGLHGILDFGNTLKMIGQGRDDAQASQDDDILKNPNDPQYKFALDRRALRQYRAGLAGDVFNPNRDDSALSFPTTGLPKEEKPLVKPGAGGGATVHIGTQNNIFNVATNSEPSRVARLIKNVVADNSRHPTSSPYVQNYSANRGGVGY